MVANPAFLEGFPFSGLLSVAPYCVPGGVRVVSIRHHIRLKLLSISGSRRSTSAKACSWKSVSTILRNPDSMRARRSCRTQRSASPEQATRHTKMRHMGDAPSPVPFYATARISDRTTSKCVPRQLHIQTDLLRIAALRVWRMCGYGCSVASGYPWGLGRFGRTSGV